MSDENDPFDPAGCSADEAAAKVRLAMEKADAWCLCVMVNGQAYSYWLGTNMQGACNLTQHVHQCLAEELMNQKLREANKDASVVYDDLMKKIDKKLH